MPRTLNFTGRQKILQGDISIQIISVSDGLRFAAEMQLDEYGFPADARVHVEAYRGLTALWKRFDFGRIGVREAPSDLSLSEFEHPDGILFRVKISAEGENRGRLLGAADGIRPRLPGEQEQSTTHLILVDKGPLGGEMWTLEFPDTAAGLPTLVMNDRIENWKVHARDPLFRALVLPGVMRQILTRILVIDADVGDEDSPASWQQLWLRFAESLAGVANHPRPLDPGEEIDSREDVREWINSAVSAFGQRNNLINAVISQWNSQDQT